MRLPMTCGMFLAFVSSLAVAGELSANRWAKVDENGGGIRAGSAVVWLAKEKKFLVVGGAYGNAEKKIARKYEVQTFDPAARTWAEVVPDDLELKSFDLKRDRRKLLMKNAKGQLRLNPSVDVAARSAWDAANRRLYVFGQIGPDSFPVAVYHVDAKTWGMVSTKRPPTEVDGAWRGQWGHRVVFMEGTAAVFDPVNDEILFIGGRTGDHPQGFVGHWAFSVEDKTWRKLEAKKGPRTEVRKHVLAAIRPARDALAAARNLHYGVEPITKDALKPALSLLDQALEQTEKAAAAPKDTTAYGARPRLDAAAEGLRSARSAFGEGAVDTTALKTLFDAIWKLDEVAARLCDMPGPRESAAVAYDPNTKSIVVFGGDHGDYLMSDTWIYDCTKRTWRQAFPKVAPKPRRARGKLVWLPDAQRMALVGGEAYIPRFQYFRRRAFPFSDVWLFDIEAEQWTMLTDGKGEGESPNLTCRIAAGADDTLVGLARQGRWRKQWVGQTWLMRFDAGEPQDSGTLGVPPATRSYLSVVKPYDPRWYDAGGREPDPEAVADWIEKLKPNVWTAVPAAPRPCPRREWGTCIFDPDRDQWYHWTGGHMADPANIVSTYHPAINRWSIPFVPSYIGKGLDFNGRPDCMNHTYLNYAYDTVSNKLVCTWGGGTSLYDPDRREFEPPIEQPFMQHAYFTKTCTTPRGVVVWTRGYVGILDADKRKWSKLPVKGKFPRSVHGDENAIDYDSKRDCLWLLAADGYGKMNGQVWRYNMKTGEVQKMDPANMKTIGIKVRPRESFYHPKLDLVVHNGFAGGRQAAYDPAENRWVVLSLKKTFEDLGGVSIGLMYDPKRDLVWAMSGNQRLFVLKLRADGLDISETTGDTK